MYTLYEVINLSMASAPDARRFLAVVKYWVRSLTPPSGESLSSKSEKSFYTIIKVSHFKFFPWVFKCKIGLLVKRIMN